MASKPRFINPKTLAPPPGYTAVVETTGPGRTIYIAGQLGLDLENKLVGEPGDFRAQCEKAFDNLAAALAAVGGKLSDVVKINNYLTDMTHMSTFRAVRDAKLNMPEPPASTTVGIAQLARPGALFEIDAVAVLPPAKAATKAGTKTGAKAGAKAGAKTASRGRGVKRTWRRR
jgi:enamine deaminase RidA (YjgF/YER057c/UK114 family)